MLICFLLGVCLRVNRLSITWWHLYNDSYIFVCVLGFSWMCAQNNKCDWVSYCSFLLKKGLFFIFTATASWTKTKSLHCTLYSIWIRKILKQTGSFAPLTVGLYCLVISAAFDELFLLKFTYFASSSARGIFILGLWTLESDRFGAMVGEMCVLLYMSAFSTILPTPAKSGFAMWSHIMSGSWQGSNFIKGLIALSKKRIMLITTFSFGMRLFNSTTKDYVFSKRIIKWTKAVCKR